MPNKIAMTVISVVLAAVLSSGCAGKSDSILNPDEPETIVLWHYYNGAQKSAFDAAVKEFNETEGYEKGVIVEAVSYGGVDELEQTVLAAANGELDAGEMPDIFGAYGNTALTVLNKGMLAEINEYLPEDVLNEYEPSFIDEGRLGTDKLYVFPIAKSSEALMINKTDFDAFIEGAAASGINVGYEDLYTWEGITRTADIYYEYTKNNSPDGKGKALIGVDTMANYLYAGAKQLGVDLIKVNNGRVTKIIDSEKLTRLWDNYFYLSATGRCIKIGKFCSDDIKTGDILCFVGSTTSASYFPTELNYGDEAAKKIELAVLPAPVFENSDKVAYSQGAGMAVSKTTKEKEYASALFLQWFTDTERNVPFALNSSYLPVKKDALDEKVITDAFASLETNDEKTQNAIKSLKVGIEQLRTYQMYSPDVFEGGVEYREALPQVLLSASEEGRNRYIEMTEDGMSHEEAYEALLPYSAEQYNNWIEFLIK